MKQNNFALRVYEIVQKIPKGKVVTYSQIALICGSPGASRAVGTALHNNPSRGIIPCHRVVNKSGKLAQNFAFGGIETQKHLLEGEGVSVDNKYKINLLKYGWKAEGERDTS